MKKKGAIVFQLIYTKGNKCSATLKKFTLGQYSSKIVFFSITKHHY